MTMLRIDVVPPEVERYAEEHTTRPPALLRQLAEETRATLASSGSGVVQPLAANGYFDSAQRMAPK